MSLYNKNGGKIPEITVEERLKVLLTNAYKDNTFDTNLIIRKPLFIGVFLYSNSIF